MKKEPKNYSQSVRAAKSHKIISAAKFISILNGNDNGYLKNFDWIEIENHIITDFVLLSDVQAKHKVRIQNSYFEDHVSLEGAHFEQHVTISTCFFEKLLRIEKCEFKDKFELLDIHIDRSLWITGGSYREVELRGYFDLKSLWILGGTFEELVFTTQGKDEDLDEFVIFNKGIKGRVRLQRLRSRKVTVHGDNSDSEFYFEDTTCDNFQFSDFTNNGVLKIYGLQPNHDKESYFEIVKSNLGKSQFYRVRFDLYKEVIFVDSYLAEINLINCEWGNNFRGIESPNFYIAERPRPFVALTERKQLKESFRQIKFVYEKQGDKISESDFYSREMNIYNSLASWSEHWYKLYTEKFWEKLILILSRRLSNYGTSFLIPFVGLLFSNLLILIIMIHFLEFKGLELAGCSLGEKEANKIAIGEFFRLMNPLHKLGEETTGWLVFWDLLARVSASYFIYNIIRASRRFIR